MRLCNFSLKGGVGRTTLALNLAGCYARDPSLRVLVNDRDPKAGPARLPHCRTKHRSVSGDRAPASTWRSPTPRRVCRTTK
jgi:cellulose biosynthesis protein BcsQ